MRTFEGIWPALLTPFTENYQINVPVLRDLVEFLISKPVDGLFVGGTTGEGIFLPLHERKLMIETVFDQARGRIPIIAHVGAVDYPR
jgi:N-acetylneuraminate lyase